MGGGSYRVTLPQPVDPAIDFGDIALRLIAATAVGALIGLDREWRGKPVGIRTLALVALGSALVAVGTVHLTVLNNEPDAVSRVVQGVIQGVMAGIGFIGAGAILRHPDQGAVQNLTTAATVWVAAALGIACGLAAWEIVGIGAALTLIVLVVLNPLDHWIDARRKKSAMAIHTDLKPIFACVSSQNGLLLECPQRQKRAAFKRATMRPVPEMISMLPRTMSGPSSVGVISTGPSRTSSMAVLSPVGGSPVASK